jgi:hypothetical protein
MYLLIPKRVYHFSKNVAAKVTAKPAEMSGLLIEKKMDI